MYYQPEEPEEEFKLTKWQKFSLMIPVVLGGLLAAWLIDHFSK